MFIIGILAVVLTESYITISKVALKVEQEKNISEESLLLTQVFQSISDEATIDYEAYSEDPDQDLKANSWFTNILYLTWDQWSWTKIYTIWWENCLDLYEDFPLIDAYGNYIDYSDKIQNATWCSLVLEKKINETESIITQLTTPWKVITSKVMFKVIPYDTDESYFNSNNWIIITNELHQPAFWMFVHLYATLYQPTGTNKIDQPLQLFFNLKL